MNWIVYTLKNPRTREIRYVGWTSKTPEKRLGSHITCAKRAPQQNHRHKWVMSLVSIGLIPVIEVVECGAGDGWADAERRWIAYYRAAGARLVNGTDGGDGAPGRGTPEERRAIARLSYANGGSVMNTSRTPEKRSADARRAVTMMNASLTAEQRSANSKKGDAKKTPEQRSKSGRASARSLNARLTPEERSASAKHATAHLTREDRARGIRKLNESMTPEERSAAAKRYQAAIKQNKSSRVPFASGVSTPRL
jgi:hypothetical protein